MSLFWQIVYFALLLFFLLLLARVVLSLVQVFARDYRPSGAMLVVFETVLVESELAIGRLGLAQAANGFEAVGAKIRQDVLDTP